MTLIRQIPRGRSIRLKTILLRFASNPDGGLPCSLQPVSVGAQNGSRFREKRILPASASYRNPDELLSSFNLFVDRFGFLFIHRAPLDSGRRCHLF
jgi:hypothetical protein